MAHQENFGRLRILIVVSSLRVGGPQRSLIALLRRVDYRRFSVSLLVLDPHRSELAHLIPEEVEVLATPRDLTAATMPKEQWLQAVLRVSRLVFPLKSAQFFGIVAGALRRRKPTQQLRQQVWGLASRSLKAIPGTYDVAIGVLGLSTYAIVDLANAKRKYHWIRSDSRILNRDVHIESAYFRTLDGALAVSGTVRDVFVEMYPWMLDSVRVYKNDILTNSVSSHRIIESQSSTTQILTVARLDRLKGLDLAIEASRILKGRGLSIQWRVLGDGPERSVLEEEIRNSDVGDRFVLQGTVLDVGQYLTNADIYVHPSRTEGRSNAVEEARALGLPIVATRYPTVGDQVTHGEDGWVCDIDAIAIADSIQLLVQNQELRSRLGERAAIRHALETDDPNSMFEDMAIGRGFRGNP